jgi:hypothetical protein
VTKDLRLASSIVATLKHHEEQEVAWPVDQSRDGAGKFVAELFDFA